MSEEKGETQKAMEEKLEQIEATRYSEADLVSFGNYLLGKERLSELGEVSHADLENWKESKN
jgi:hypothetical protein